MYLAGDFKRRELLREDEYTKSEHDSELEQEVYQEFWEEIDREEIKKTRTERKAQSVIRGSTVPKVLPPSAEGVKTHGRNAFDRKATATTLPSI